MNTEEVEAMEPNAWIDFRPEQAFAPSHCDAWTEVAILTTIRMDTVHWTVMTTLISR